MKIYLVALGAGLLVGVIYGLMNVRSPAPPIVALVGLLGILIGEQVVPLGKRLLVGDPITAAVMKAECADHVLGTLPQRPENRPAPPA